MVMVSIEADVLPKTFDLIPQWPPGYVNMQAKYKTDIICKQGYASAWIMKLNSQTGGNETYKQGGQTKRRNIVLVSWCPSIPVITWEGRRNAQVVGKET